MATGWCFTPGNKTSTVKTIERWSAPPPRQAEAGESIGITLTEQIFVAARARCRHWKRRRLTSWRDLKRGYFGWARKPFATGKTYKLKLATQEAECAIDSIERVIDSSTLETISRTEVFVGRNEVAELTLRTKRPVAFDVHAEIIADGPVCDCGWV